jgi:hypothetical protein
MNQLIWRLHRTQVYFAVGALGALTILLLVTGITMAHDYHVFLANCAATRSCSEGADRLFSGDGSIMDLVNFTLVVPLLFGLFWGAPLLAKELEDGTHNLAWTQGVTRGHWMRSNVMWALVAAAVWGAAMAALVSWWRFPENAIDSRFAAFDVQGIVPVAYSIFAVALGIAVGSIFKRVLPAIATTLGVFVAIRVAIGVYVRPHYLTPISKLFPLSGPKSNGPIGSWTISSGIRGPHGHFYGNSFDLSDVPKACGTAFPGGGSISNRCMAAHGFHQLITYQPDSRFWAFQGIEAAAFILMAVGLIGFAFWRVLSRDA